MSERTANERGEFIVDVFVAAFPVADAQVRARAESPVMLKSGLKVRE